VSKVTFHSQRAQTQSRAAREQIEVNDRLSFSPAEFAALNGKSATWGYRRIYQGDVRVISDAGRLLIPRSEVDKFLARAAQYNPQTKATSDAGENGGEA
jgi:hypothetical protein